MTAHSTMRLPAPVTEIPVSDLKAAVAYYHDKFGFDLDWAEDGIGLAGISRGECRLFLANMEYRNKYGKVVPVRIWLNMDSKAEVDQLYRDWSTRQAMIAAEPDTKPWGLHEFTATDLDDNIFRVFYDFATPERESK